MTTTPVSTTSFGISMAERRRGRRSRSSGDREEGELDDALPAVAAQVQRGDKGEEDTERALGRFFAFGIPALGLASALAVGLASGLARALLVLAGTALLSTIAFLWASLRVLGGEAPIDEVRLRRVATSEMPARDKKRQALRALKDLAFEHEVGKIDDADYAALDARYRTAAKQILREMDDDVAPRRERAEALVAKYLAKHNVAPQSPAPEPAAPVEKPAVATPRTCSACAQPNDADAVFCKKCGASLAATAAAEKGADASS
jgi:hypothetical protein